MELLNCSLGYGTIINEIFLFLLLKTSYLCSVNLRYRLEIGAAKAEWRELKSDKTMKNQINHTNEGTQAQVNNLSYTMQMAELEAQMEQETIKEQMLLADLECQAEQDAVLEQMTLLDLECHAEENAITDAYYLAELAVEAEEDAIADILFMADLAYQDAMVLPF